MVGGVEVSLSAEVISAQLTGACDLASHMGWPFAIHCSVEGLD